MDVNKIIALFKSLPSWMWIVGAALIIIPTIFYAIKRTGKVLILLGIVAAIMVYGGGFITTIKDKVYDTEKQEFVSTDKLVDMIKDGTLKDAIVDSFSATPTDEAITATPTPVELTKEEKCYQAIKDLLPDDLSELTLKKLKKVLKKQELNLPDAEINSLYKYIKSLVKTD